MGRYRKSMLSFCCISLALFVFGRKLPAEEPGKEDRVCFRWAFGALVGPENDRRLVAITRDTTLKRGDRLKMLVELKKPCFVYLIYHAQQNQIQMLLPYDLQQFDRDWEISKKYYIPQGGLWFELDENAGLETFYLLASAERLVELERLLAEYEHAASREKGDLAGKILAEIHKVKRRYRTLTSTPERPIPIGGNLRGITGEKEGAFPDIDPIAAEVRTGDFYARTFTIDHR